MLGGDVTILTLLQTQIGLPYLALITDCNYVIILPIIKTLVRTKKNKSIYFLLPLKFPVSVGSCFGGWACSRKKECIFKI